MALSQEIINSTELAKSTVLNSDFDDDYKKTLLQLLNTTMIATNGISPEEKIQKMTDAVHMLTVSQITFLSKIDERITKSIKAANTKQCSSCKALKHANEVEEQKKHEEFLEAWKKANGITDDDMKTDTLSNTLKSILVKPYVWIFGSILVFSPYGVDILKLILNTFSR